MLSKDYKEEIIKEFAQSDNDTGSCQVQIAILSKRIKQISEHLKSFPKDKASTLGLVKLVGKRRAFYSYLKKNDKDSYEKLRKKMKEKSYI